MKKTNQILKYFLLIAVALTCVYPIIWLIINSFKTQADLYANPWGWTTSFTWANYNKAIVEGNIGRYFLNSIIISVSSVTSTVLLAVIAAYGIVRLKWKWSRLVLALFTVGMMLPPYSSLIPLYSAFSKMNILNTYLAVIIPNVTFGLSMAVFIMSGFFITLPKEIEEAAIIDGCSLPRAFTKIIFPIVRSGTVTIAVITFVNVWNDLLFSQIFLNDREIMPLPIGLTEFKGQYGTDHVGMIAAVVITVIPVVIVYSFLHDKIIEGMTAGAVKG